MIKTLNKSAIEGEIAVPSSKSALQRYIAGAMLAEGESIIGYDTLSDDSEFLVGVANSLGSNVIFENERLRIIGRQHKPLGYVNVGESGLGLRMIAPILAALGRECTISGKGSLLKRPVDFVVNSLRDSGVHVEFDGKSLPIKIVGKISQKRISIDGINGSQLITGYLMAAPLLNSDIEIFVENLKSKPYIDLTIQILKEFGIEVLNSAYQRFYIPKGQVFKPVNTICEGDWSGAAFPMVAGAIGGKVKIKGLKLNSLQGDKAILDVVKNCGAIVFERDDEIIVQRSDLNAFTFDATDAPDLFPPLVALAVHCKGKSVIRGVSRLKHKESDRGQSLLTEFSKLGAAIRINDDMMIIEPTDLKGNRVHSNNDHRIAMALAVAAIGIDGQVEIENAEAVSKSWPDFYEKMANIGLNCL